MTVREIRLTRFIKSRVTAVLLAVAAVIAALAASGAGVVTPIPGWKGLGLPSPNLWIADPETSLAVNLLLTLAIAAFTVYLNRRFNLLRTLSLLFAAFYPIMLCALPTAMCRFNGGTLLTVLILLATMLLYECYNAPRRLRSIFLAFFIVAAGALTQYGFVAYLPILLIGCGQMRIFHFKTLLAALIGIATPLWLAWGFGVIDFSDFHGPEFTTVYSTMSASDKAHLAATVGVTGLVLIALSVVNMIRIFSYNARARALNGFLLALSLVTVVMTAVDFTNVPFYYPMLCCCTVFQIGHFNKINADNRACYITMLSLIAVYAGLYTWSLAL